MKLISAILLGYVAGTRSMLAPAAASWASQTNKLDVNDSPVSFLRNPAAPLLLSTLATGELVGDKLPIMPSRKSPLAFMGRIMSGALAGAAVGGRGKAAVKYAAIGAAAACAGTLCGSALRSGLARKFGRDFPAALAEDAIALGLLALSVQQMHRTEMRRAA